MALTDEKKASVFALNCVGHQQVLAMKPVTQRVPGVTSLIVRMGHITEAKRTFAGILLTAGRQARKTEYYRVAELPPECAQWERERRAILDLSRPARDMTDEEVDLVCKVDNGPPGDLVAKHFCIGPTCVCGGTPAQACDAMETCAYICLGSGCGLALEYRWKGVESGGAWVHRGCNIHEYSPNALKAVSNPKKLADAERALEYS